MRKGRIERKVRSRGEGGFTLMEVCVALVIFMFVSLSAASVFIYAITNNGNAGDRAMAVALAQQRLEQLRGINYSDLETTVPATGQTPLSVTTGGRSYQVAVSYAYKPTGATAATATLKTVTVTVTPVGGSGLLTNTVSVTAVRSTLEIGDYSR